MTTSHRARPIARADHRKVGCGPPLCRLAPTVTQPGSQRNGTSRVSRCRLTAAAAHAAVTPPSISCCQGRTAPRTWLAQESVGGSPPDANAREASWGQRRRRGMSPWSGPAVPARPPCSRACCSCPGQSGAKAAWPTAPPWAMPAPRSRARQMSTEISVAGFTAHGLDFTILDCPGSVEFVQDAYSAALGCDAALVVVEPVLERLITRGAAAPLPRRARDSASDLHQQDGSLGGPLPRPAANAARPEHPAGRAAPVRDRPRR